MNFFYNDEASQLRSKYLKNQSKLTRLSDALQNEIFDYQTIEEQASHLEKSIHSNMLSIKSIEKQYKLTSSKLQSKSSHPSSSPIITDLPTFVSSSKSIFSSKIFENLKQDSKHSELLQGQTGDILLEIASICEKVNSLKSRISDIKRAELSLNSLQKSDTTLKTLQISEEIQNYSTKTVKVFYKTLQNLEESCDFPTLTPQGSKITFTELLKYSCQYWGLIDLNCVLTDQELIIWPGSSFVKDEINDEEKKIWLMTREEANYLRLVNKKEDRGKGDENGNENGIEEDGGDDLESTRNLEVNLGHDEKVAEEKLRLDEKKTGLQEELILDKRRNWNLIHLLVYGIYIIGFTWALLQFNKVEKSFWTRMGVVNSIFNVNFPVNSSTSLSFDSMNLYEDFRNFLKEPFIDALYKSINYNGEEFSDDDKFYLSFVSYKKRLK